MNNLNQPFYLFEIKILKTWYKVIGWSKPLKIQKTWLILHSHCWTFYEISDNVPFYVFTYSSSVVKTRLSLLKRLLWLWLESLLQKQNKAAWYIQIVNYEWVLKQKACYSSSPTEVQQLISRFKNCSIILFKLTIFLRQTDTIFFVINFCFVKTQTLFFNEVIRKSHLVTT